MDRDALIDAGMNAYLDFFGYSELNREREAFARVLAAIAPAIRAAALEEAAARADECGYLTGVNLRAMINAPPTTP